MLLARFVVLCFFFTVAAGQCSNSQFTYSSVDQRCYFASRTSAPWATARNLCNNMGAQLAVIHDGSTNLAVDQAGLAVDPNLIFWIGLQVTGGVFQWIDGTSMDYTSWNVGFPQLVKGYDCVAERMLNRGAWENILCANSYPYICQANATFIPGSTTPPPFFCHNNPYYGPSGSVASPNYPGNYPDNAYCIYNIILSPSATVRLFMTDFFTEACCDFLYIYDGPNITSPLISRCAGTNCLSNNFYSSSNAMTLLFTSDPSINYRGFNASFTSIYPTTIPFVSTTAVTPANCTTYNATGSGQIYSYNYPSNYTNDLDCFYILNANSGLVPSIYFSRFQTETNYDNLYFYDGSAVTFAPNGQVIVTGTSYLRLSGTQPQGQTYYGRTQKTVLRFVTDQTVTGPGFSGQWSSAAIPSSTPSG